MQQDVTFRDFAGAVMTGDRGKASAVLETLLGVSADDAAAATAVFVEKMTDPAFMPKAMGLRTAVTSGTDDEVSALLTDCFGLDEPARTSAVATLRTRYPR